MCAFIHVYTNASIQLGRKALTWFILSFNSENSRLEFKKESGGRKCSIGYEGILFIELLPMSCMSSISNNP